MPSLKTWHYDFDGLIWSIKVDHYQPGIALEIRNKDRKEVSFFSLDPITLAVMPIIMDSAEKWLWGIETITRSTIILHGFVSESSPQHNYLIAFDSKNGQKLWENYHDTFYDESDEGIVVYNSKIEPRNLRLINPVNGQQIKNTIDETHFPKQKKSTLTFPELIHNKETVPTYLPDNSQIIEQITFNDFQIYTYNIESKQYICIINEKKNIKEVNIISENNPTTSSDSFFIYNNQLIFIKNKSQFVSYFL